jgi:tRNA splicing ligase
MDKFKNVTFKYHTGSILVTNDDILASRSAMINTEIISFKNDNTYMSSYDINLLME